MGSAAKALSAPKQDELDCTIWVLFDLVVPKANHFPSLGLKKCGSIAVVGSRRLSMLAAIQLDRQLRFPARQVDDEWVNDELAGESRSVMAQSQPQKSFGFR